MDKLREAATFAHRTLVDFKIARTLADCRVGGAATEVSRVVNKLRAALREGDSNETSS